MELEKFYKLINKDKYQVFVLSSRASLPFIFSVHPWLLINKKGKISRYEVGHRRSSAGTYLHVDVQPPFQGLSLFSPIPRFFQKTKLLAVIEGDENSRAKQLIDTIESSKENYPYLRKYAFLGANCATYVAWALKDFPELKVKLPWNAFGKNFK